MTIYKGTIIKKEKPTTTYKDLIKRGKKLQRPNLKLVEKDCRDTYHQN